MDRLAYLSANAGAFGQLKKVVQRCVFNVLMNNRDATIERGDQGLVILGFPCNQFGGQEPDDA